MAPRRLRLARSDLWCWPLDCAQPRAIRRCGSQPVANLINIGLDVTTHCLHWHAHTTTLRSVGAPGPLAQALRTRVQSRHVRQLQLCLLYAKYRARYDVGD